MTYRAQCIGRRTTKRRFPNRQTHSRSATPAAVYRLLRDLWPQKGGLPVMRKPAWATLARDRGWMTMAAFDDVPEEDTGRVTGPGIHEYMNAPSPWFSMLAKIPKEPRFGT